MLRSFSPNAFAFGLASWSWLGTHGKTPRFTTAFGDVFLESLEGWWLLDTIEGTLTLRWANAVDLYAELDSEAGREEILLEDILMETMNRGVVLQDDEVLAFVPHPAAGGRLSADTCSPLRFELALSLAGQVHGELLARAQPAPNPMLWAPEPEPVGFQPEPVAYPHEPTAFQHGVGHDAQWYAQAAAYPQPPAHTDAPVYPEPPTHTGAQSQFWYPVPR